MSLPSRPIAFVLASTNHGSMIVNRNDQSVDSEGLGIGVGLQLLTNSCFDPHEVQFLLDLLSLRRRYFGDGVFAIDGGANIGVHSIEWARHMHGWGRVLSFEAQEAIYYALCGNLALNNCFNARAKLTALGEAVGEIVIPQLDYTRAGSYGSLELRQRAQTEPIGQPVSYDAASGVPVPMVTIDSLSLARLDFLKLDVEGMELDVFKGARQTLDRCKPALFVETFKSDEAAIKTLLGELGYGTTYSVIGSLLAFHESDPLKKHMVERDGVVYIG
jgi:FkbM family methyltransferase